MAYLPGYQYDIFISYAHVDNDPYVKGEEGWVDQFCRSLKSLLAQQLGRDKLAIWRDEQLAGVDILKPSITEACQGSALLVSITSPGYMASEWCLSEYEVFCSANQSQFPAIRGRKSRIFNVRLREPLSKEHKAGYEERFGSSLGYVFYDPGSGPIRRPIPLNVHDPRYRSEIEKLASDILTLLGIMSDDLEIMGDDMRKEPDPIIRFVLTINSGTSTFDHKQVEEFLARIRDKYSDARITLMEIMKSSASTQLILEAPRIIYERINELVETGTAWSQLGINAAALYPGSLHEILQQAKERLIISGHTLNRFSDDAKTRYTLESLLHKGVRVTLITLNPKSKYAQAHAPYHELESESPAEDQHKKSLEFLGKLFELLDDESKARFEVLLSNYMPRFRTILVDDERVYLYLYMYGEDVTDYPDFVFEKTEQTLATQDETKNSVFTRILASTDKLIKAPEIIPYIRYGKRYKYWKHSRLAEWDSWSNKERERHKNIYRYYVDNAKIFHMEWSHVLEDYVKAHLNLLSGRTLVLGCGSGKEVNHLADGKMCSDLYGVDFSPKAIEIANEKKQEKYPDSNARFIVADFYDLEHIVEGKFDSIVANAAFVHLFERDHMSTILRRIWRKLNPGGLCFIRTLYKENEHGEPMPYDNIDSMYSDERWFVYFSYTSLAQLAMDAGFSVKEDVTRKIAEECELSELDVVMSKGFRHISRTTPPYPVRWPTILLKKPGSNER